LSNEAIIIAGANGSGKTTFAKLFVAEHPFAFVNADEIAKKIALAEPDNTMIKAGKLFFKQIDTLIAGNKNLIIESTLSGRSLLNLIKRIKDKGYIVRIIYIFLETSDICIERIKERVRKGGHFVPDTDVIRRFHRSKKNFWNFYREEVDEWFLIHNSQQQFVELAFGSRNEFSINDSVLFERFIKDIQEGVHESQ